MIQPLVSVLMPCYNAEATVDEAVASILQQTLQDLELIAVDDGSTDGTAARLENWAGKDRRVCLARGEHAGLVPSLQAGLRLCRVQVIARHDADDIARPERLEAQLGLLQSEPSLAAVGCMVEAFPEEDVREGLRVYLEWQNGLLTPEAIARQIFVESPLAHPSLMIRRAWLERVGGYQDNAWPEDYDLLLRLHLAGARFGKVPRLLVRWREHARRLTRIDPRYSVEAFLRAKAHYLRRGPLGHAPKVILWGAGQMGRRLSKHLLREGVDLAAFVDIDPEKIGRVRRGRPIHDPADLPRLLLEHQPAVVLAAVGARGARRLIRDRLTAMGLEEGRDWWAVA
ncbi:MAG TPA: glycosyltransferase [Anaerolineales bacterium]|nr:glycosyltransferase [Anaerolineales bacterium]